MLQANLDTCLMFDKLLICTRGVEYMESIHIKMEKKMKLKSLINITVP